MMRVLFFAYPQYADFEVAHTLFFLRKIAKAEVVTATIDGRAVKSLGGLRTEAQAAVPEVEISQFELLLISGGDGVHQVIDDPAIHQLLKKAQQAKEIKNMLNTHCSSAGEKFKETTV